MTHENCEFCEGAAAARQGESKDSNPYPVSMRSVPPEVPSSYHMWRFGWMSENVKPEDWKPSPWRHS